MRPHSVQPLVQPRVRRGAQPPGARASRVTGAGRLLIVTYATLSLAASGRSAFQIAVRFDEAPIAFTLSALSAVIYVVATVALVVRGWRSYCVAWGAVAIEFVGVVVVGTVSVVAPAWLGVERLDPLGRNATVWSAYGLGYFLVPLVLPVLGMVWLVGHSPGRPTRESSP